MADPVEIVEARRLLASPKAAVLVGRLIRKLDRARTRSDAAHELARTTALELAEALRRLKMIRADNAEALHRAAFATHRHSLQKPYDVDRAATILADMVSVRNPKS